MIYYIATALFVSILLNIIACSYSVYAARRLLVVDSNIEGIQENFVAFREHLEGLYETEMFHGDPSLQALIEHSKLVLDEVDKYENLFTLVLEEETEDEKEESVG